MGNPITSLEKLSEPVTKLVEVIAAGIGRVYAPFGTVRQARADATAKIIHAKADGSVIEIQERANARVQHREAVRQQNIERIASQAALELPEKVSSNGVNLDWTLQYFDHAQDVCDENMQKLWARILAGEVANPGSYSKRTLQFLKTLDKGEAEAFTYICSLCLTEENGWYELPEEPEMRQTLSEKYGDADYVAHFTSIGLLLPATGEVLPSTVRKGVELTYFGRNFVLETTEEEKKGPLARLEIGIGLRAFSSIGQQLASIAGAVPFEGYVERLANGCDERYKIKFREH
ncbi:MAG: DUF2806 domain-containing protein [Thiobacillus sp.]|nr:DUF2806 domain-containing protein [Thiobacillus sp.]